MEKSHIWWTGYCRTSQVCRSTELCSRSQGMMARPAMNDHCTLNQEAAVPEAEGIFDFMVLDPSPCSPLQARLVSLHPKSVGPSRVCRAYAPFCDEFPIPHFPSKILRKHQMAVWRLLFLLGGDASSLTRTSPTCLQLQIGSTRLSVRNSGLLTYRVKDDSEDIPSSAATYNAVSFSHGPQFHFRSRHFLNVRSSDIQNTVLMQPDGQSVFEEISIMSGSCLFNSDLLKKIKGVPQNCSLQLQHLARAPSLYEIEVIPRLSSAIADLAILLIARLSTCNRRQMSGSVPRVLIKLDVPRVQYYGLGLEKVENGEWTTKELREWFALVDERNDRQAQSFRAAIIREMGLRSSDWNSYLSISMAHGTSSWEQAIKDAINNDRLLGPGECLRALCRDPQQGWQTVLELVEKEATPKTLSEVMLLTYPYEHLAPVLGRKVCLTEDGRGKLQRTSGRHLIVCVDDRSESPIYSKARSLLRKLEDSQGLPRNHHLILAMYTLSKVIWDGDRGESCLYAYSGRPLSSLDRMNDLPSYIDYTAPVLGAEEVVSF